MPGASVFQLRGLGYRLSRARIVAMTEDHCRVPPDWAKKMLDAHAAHPEAAAIGGSVENGAPRSGLDWASFLVVQTLMAAPIMSGPTTKIAGAVNVGYKREALEPIDDFDGLGALDVLHQRELQRSGDVLLADDAIRVVHDQSLGLRGTTAIQLPRRADDRRVPPPEDGHDGLGAVPGCADRSIRPVGSRRRRVAQGYGRTIARTWPAILFLFLVQAVGQVVGFVAGPGDSPRRVQ